MPSSIENSRRDLAIRCLLALIPIGVSVWLALRATEPNMAVFSAFPGLLAASLIVFPSLTSAVGHVFSGIYMPSCDDLLPRAPLDQADRFLFLEDWDEAECELWRLAEEYPYDMGLWERVFELNWIHRPDPTRAALAHRRALQQVGDMTLWPQINHLYCVHGRRHLGEGADWEAERDAVQRRMAVARRVREV